MGVWLRFSILLSALILSVGVIVWLATNGMIDPGGPIGPVGVVLSFGASLIAIIAFVGLMRPLRTMQLGGSQEAERKFEEGLDLPEEHDGSGRYSNQLATRMAFLIGILGLLPLGLAGGCALFFSIYPTPFQAIALTLWLLVTGILALSLGIYAAYLQRPWRFLPYLAILFGLGLIAFGVRVIDDAKAEVREERIRAGSSIRR